MPIKETAYYRKRYHFRRIERLQQEYAALKFTLQRPASAYTTAEFAKVQRRLERIRSMLKSSIIAYQSGGFVDTESYDLAAVNKIISEGTPTAPATADELEDIAAQLADIANSFERGNK